MPEKCCKKAKMPSNKMFANETKNKEAKKLKNYISIYSKKKSCDKLCKMQMPSICYQFLKYILVNITVICCTRDCFWFVKKKKKNQHFCKTLPLIKHWPIKVSDWVIMLLFPSSSNGVGLGLQDNFPSLPFFPPKIYKFAQFKWLCNSVYFKARFSRLPRLVSVF